MPDTAGTRDVGHIKATKAPEGATTGAAIGTERSIPRRPVNLHKCWPPHTQFDISPDMNRSIFYIIGVIVVIVIVLKLLGLF